MTHALEYQKSKHHEMIGVWMDRTHQPKNPRLFLRQRLLINLLDSLDGPTSSRDFQKLLFLYCQESDSNSLYEFVPYQFGAFSFTSYADRRKLIAHGLLVDEDACWQLTAKGRSVAQVYSDAGIASFVSRHRTLRGDALVADTYRRFPYYAIRSKIADRVLRTDRETLRHINAEQPKVKRGTLFTIGYERRSLENYLNLLLQSGVALLCDVRRNAVSRKYGFSKSTLANACDGVGIRYEHLPELGIGTGRRRALGSMADYRRLLQEYEQHVLPQQFDAIATIRRWIQSGACIALTCYERDSEYCHRGRVAKEIERQADTRLSVSHL